MNLQGIFDSALQVLSKIPGYDQLTVKLSDIVQPVYEKIDEFTGIDKYIQSGMSWAAAALGLSVTGPIGVAIAAGAAILNELLGDWFADAIADLFGMNHTNRPDAPDGFHWGQYPVYIGEATEKYGRPSAYNPQDSNQHIPIKSAKPVMYWGNIKAIRTDVVLIHNETGIPVTTYRKTKTNRSDAWVKAHALQNVVGFTLEGYAIITNPTFYGDFAGTPDEKNGPHAKINRKTYSYAEAAEFMVKDKSCTAAEAAEAVSKAQAVALQLRRQRGAMLGGLGVTGVIAWLLWKRLKK